MPLDAASPLIAFVLGIIAIPLLKQAVRVVQFAGPATTGGSAALSAVTDPNH